jgi:hypothetical protein
MSVALPLSIQIGVPAVNNREVGSIARDVRISNSIPGGFGSFSCRLQGPDQTIVDHLQSVVVAGPLGDILFEGRIEDARPYVDGGDEGIEIEAYGWRRVLEFTPYRRLIVVANPDFQQASLTINLANMRPDRISVSIGQYDSQAVERIGVGLTVASGIGLSVGNQNAAQFFPTTNLGLARLAFDYECGLSATAVVQGQYYSINDSGSWSQDGIINVSGSGSVSTTLINNRGIGLLLYVSTGGTTTAGIGCDFFNIRILGSRSNISGTSVSTEPVYGHEVVQDIAAFCPDLRLSQKDLVDASGFTVPHAFWPESEPCSQALDTLTNMYDRYWAVWENRTLHWLPNDFVVPEWQVLRKEMTGLNLDRTISESASAVRIRWNGADDQIFEDTVTDSRSDNVWRAAGATKIDIVDLGRSASAAAAQVGAQYFPDRSYPVVKGSVTVPALAPIGVHRTRFAYMARAGETLVLPDALLTSKPTLSTSYDRQSTFQIRSVSIDWEEQQVTLEFDNQRDRLSQLLARIQYDLSSRFNL